MKEDRWIIWSIEHGAWWGWNHKGYVKRYSDAGVYSYDEAIKIVKGGNAFSLDRPNEAMIALETITTSELLK